jgi:hypothetical protein
MNKLSKNCVTLTFYLSEAFGEIMVVILHGRNVAQFINDKNINALKGYPTQRIRREMQNTSKCVAPRK